MQKYSDAVLDKNGKAIAGATITVITYPDGLPATIYAADGGPAVATVTTDQYGRFAFYAANGHYSVMVSGTGITPITYNDITLFDPNDLAASGGARLVKWVRTATGAVARWVSDKLSDTIDAADFINIPGASDSLDQAGVQAAINEAHRVGGGRVTVRKPIRNVWDLSLLTIPSDVIVDDQRYIDSGHVSLYGMGDDVELRLHGSSVPGGEGPSLVTVNKATSGDQTSSFVARAGSGAGSIVVSIVHWGWWTGSVWKKVIDFLTQHTDGFRSNLRLGFGAVIVNPNGTGENIDPETAAANSLAFAVNNRSDDGGGSLWRVYKGRVVVPPGQDMQIHGGALRLMNAAGAQRFSLIPDFPSSGQVTLYDHLLSKSMAVFTSGGGIGVGLNGLSLTASAASGVGTGTLFLDSADNKLKYKDAGGTVNALY